MRILFCFLLLLCCCPAPLCAAPIALHKGSVIIAEGDSLTYGLDETEQGEATQINGALQKRSPAPYPETLEALLNDCASVINHGYPGDRSVDGLVRWQHSEPAALAILMFGSNDALNHGNAPTGAVSIETYRDVMGLLIQRHKKHGQQVLVLSPPPLGGPKSDELTQPYRIAARNIAKQWGVPFFDTSILTQKVSQVWIEDKTHLSVEANTFLAHELAKLISCH